MNILFENTNPQIYLKFRLSSFGKERRGVKTRFARAIQCDAAYVSRILEGSAILSLEQAMRANDFLGHTPQEAEYFLTQISFVRAGSKELRDYFKQRLDFLKEQHATLSKRIKDIKSLPEINQATYYSLWLYPAIDVATSVPSLQTVEALCEYFHLPPATITSVLSFLSESGVVVYKDGKWASLNRRFYLTSDSPHIRKHHLNWRLKAMQSIEQMHNKNLHYSSVLSLSQKDFEKVKELFIQTVEKVREIVKASKDEIVAVYNIDCFSLNE